MKKLIETIEDVISVLGVNGFGDYGLAIELHELKKEFVHKLDLNIDVAWERVLNLIYDDFLDIDNKLHKDKFTDMRLDILCLVCKKDREVLKQLFL